MTAGILKIDKMRKLCSYNDIRMPVSIGICYGYILGCSCFGTRRKRGQFPLIRILSTPGYSYKADWTTVVNNIGLVHRYHILDSIPIQVAHFQTITAGEVWFIADDRVIDDVFFPRYVLPVRCLCLRQPACHRTWVPKND